MKTEITEIKATLRTKKKELNSIKTKIGILESKFKNSRTNYPYSIKVSILKNSRETYGKKSFLKLWNKAEGVNRYIYEDGIVYYDKATISFGQNLWERLGDYEKEALKDCITTDKHETQNNMREILDKVYFVKISKELGYLQGEKLELVQSINELKKKLSYFFSVEEELNLRVDKPKTTGLLKKVSLNFEKKTNKSLIKKEKQKKESLITKVKRSNNSKKETTHNTIIEILSLEKKEILEDYYNKNKSFTKISEELNSLYKKQLDKYKREVSFYDKVKKERVSKVLPPRVRMTHIRKLIERESLKTSANSTCYKRDYRLSA